MITERDLYLAWSLKRSKAVNGAGVVVGVVGRGHLRGVVHALLRDRGGAGLRWVAAGRPAEGDTAWLDPLHTQHWATHVCSHQQRLGLMPAAGSSETEDGPPPASFVCSVTPAMCTPTPALGRPAQTSCCRFSDLVDGRNSRRVRRQQAAGAAVRLGVELALGTAAYLAWVAWQG